MSKRLQIDYVRVNKVQFGQKTSLEEGVLTVCKEELIDLVKNELFGTLDNKLDKDCSGYGSKPCRERKQHLLPMRGTEESRRRGVFI